jgi:hypothetical protein
MITTTIRTLTVAAGLAAASSSMAETAVGLPDIPEQTRRHLAASMLPMMPAEHRAAIIAAGGIGSDIYATGLEPADDGELLVAHDERYASCAGSSARRCSRGMDETHLKSLLYRKVVALRRGRRARRALLRARNRSGARRGLRADVPRAVLGRRRERRPLRDLHPLDIDRERRGTGLRGTPITLTYSYAPDGSLADNLFNQNRSSQLFSWLNGIYGNPSTWQALFDSVFQDWSDVTGNTYIRELNDDGVEANTLPGQLGVRGDVRIFAVPLDGGFGVLAYNQFPNGGDMVFDAFDSFFNSTSSNSRRLRNVASHEHGHGLGFAHSCPQNGTKLMEPSANINFDGPQRDDTLAGPAELRRPLRVQRQRRRGDRPGNYSVGTLDIISNVTLDDGRSVDYYRINVTEPIQLNILLQPDGGSFRTGPQNPNGSCSSGTLNNFDDNLDLSIEVLALRRHHQPRVRRRHGPRGRRVAQRRRS